MMVMLPAMPKGYDLLVVDEQGSKMTRLEVEAARAEPRNLSGSRRAVGRRSANRRRWQRRLSEQHRHRRVGERARAHRDGSGRLASVPDHLSSTTTTRRMRSRLGTGSKISKRRARIRCRFRSCRIERPSLGRFCTSKTRRPRRSSTGTTSSGCVTSSSSFRKSISSARAVRSSRATSRSSRSAST